MGALRVAEARKLAIYLLRNDKNWTESRIDEAMDSRKEQFVTLKERGSCKHCLFHGLG